MEAAVGGGGGVVDISISLTPADLRRKRTQYDGREMARPARRARSLIGSPFLYILVMWNKALDRCYIIPQKCEDATARPAGTEDGREKPGQALSTLTPGRASTQLEKPAGRQSAVEAVSARKAKSLFACRIVTRVRIVAAALSKRVQG
jgi:hypothetical protein